MPRRQELLIADLLPAGLEIENPSLGNAQDKTTFPFLPKLSEPEFTEARDDRYVAAVNLDGDKRFAVAYLVRAVTPGDFAHPGAFVEDMYHPENHARTGFGRLVVGTP